MATINEDYVSFETAKLLREKGFKELTLAYAYGQDMIGYYSQPRVTDDYNVEAGRYPLPTLQMAMKWLREVHKLEVTPFHEVFQGSSWWYLIERNTSLSLLTEYEEDAIYGSYEQAAEAGIKYCLENLIK